MYRCTREVKLHYIRADMSFTLQQIVNMPSASLLSIVERYTMHVLV